MWFSPRAMCNTPIPSLTTFLSFYFYLHHINIWKNRNVRAETCDNKWLVRIFSLFWTSGLRKTIGDLSHMCGKLYVCTRGFEVYFMLQPQSSPKVTISIYVIWCKLLFHSTILLPFPRLYKAELTTLPSMIQMMRLKISGGGSAALRFYQNQSHHHHQEEEDG